MTTDQSPRLLKPLPQATVTIEIKQRRPILTCSVSPSNGKFQRSSYTTYKETIQQDVDSSSVEELKAHLEQLLASTQQSNELNVLPVPPLNQKPDSLNALSKSSIPMAREAICRAIFESENLVTRESDEISQAHLVPESTTDGYKEPSVKELYELSKYAFKLVQKYCRLAQVQNPTPEEDRQLDALLLLAEYDDQLSTLFDAATELLNYELGITEEQQ